MGQIQKAEQRESLQNHLKTLLDSVTSTEGSETDSQPSSQTTTTPESEKGRGK